MKRLKFILIFSLAIISILAQSPKREMRATWLATVWQIDWPSSVVSSTGNTLQIKAQKDMMIRILDSLVSANMNAVCFQIRSRCDAMYNSAYEPWSTDLVATRGLNPGYDPLQFVIDEGHKRGIEVHAWLNPYRYESSVNQWSGPNDYRATHPDWLLTYASGASILDPGNPAVMFRIKQVVGDIIQKYDVDGILFDDYFYAYGGTPATLDASTQALYKPSNMNVDDWRRANVNKMVAQVYDTIQAVKPYLKFGVSPFGIWTTNQTVAAQEGIILPPGITGGNMYAEIYCDPIAWLKQGKVDYVSPQLYWGTGGSQDYGTLCPWWSTIANQFGKHFYSSQDIAGLSTSNYVPAMRTPALNTIVEMNGEKLNINFLTQIERKLSSTSKSMKAPAANFTQEQIGTQIGINRSSDENNAPGSIFFSTKQLYQTKGFINYLKKMQFTQKALVPAVDWKQHPTYGLVNNITLTSNVLSWTSSATNVRYAIYAVPTAKLSEVGNFSTSTYLLGITYTNSFTIPEKISTTTNTFAVAILDRYGNEFPVQIMGQSQGTPSVAVLISPTNAETKIMPFVFSWQADNSVDNYLFEIAEDATFINSFCSKELKTTTFSTTLLDALQPGKTYYWRVKTRKPNTPDGISEVRSFIPQHFSLISPVSGTTDASITPTISWQNVNGNSAYLLEVCTNNQFVSTTIVYSKTVSGTSFTIPVKVLSGATTYYVRVSTDVLGVNTISNVVNFTTLNIIPGTPVFTSPAMNSSVFGTEIKVTWSEGVSTGYWVEMSKDITFPVRSTTVKSVGAYIFEVTYSGLTPADYFFRMRASYSATYTNFSENLKVNLNNNTGIDDLKSGNISCKVLRNSNSQYSLWMSLPNEAFVSASLITLSGIQMIQVCNNLKLNAGENTISIAVDKLPKGVYLLKIKTNEDEQTLKFIN